MTHDTKRGFIEKFSQNPPFHQVRQGLQNPQKLPQNPPKLGYGVGLDRNISYLSHKHLI